jgi:hypothetical protein
MSGIGIDLTFTATRLGKTIKLAKFQHEKYDFDLYKIFFMEIK